MSEESDTAGVETDTCCAGASTGPGADAGAETGMGAEADAGAGTGAAPAEGA